MLRKNLALPLLLLFFSQISSTLACSIGVNDTYQQNMLAALAASHFDVSLAAVKAVKLLSFEKLFEAEDSSSCPQYLNTWGRVSLSWSPNEGENCSASVTVEVLKFVGDKTPAGPVEEISFIAPEATCSTSSRIFSYKNSAASPKIEVPRSFAIEERSPSLADTAHAGTKVFRKHRH